MSEEIEMPEMFKDIFWWDTQKPKEVKLTKEQEALKVLQKMLDVVQANKE